MAYVSRSLSSRSTSVMPNPSARQAPRAWRSYGPEDWRLRHGARAVCAQPQQVQHSHIYINIMRMRVRVRVRVRVREQGRHDLQSNERQHQGTYNNGTL
eukprot:COSAG05_NODE_77_length_21410_cov_1079.308573_4_plen_99_part_00